MHNVTDLKQTDLFCVPIRTHYPLQNWILNPWMSIINYEKFRKYLHILVSHCSFIFMWLWQLQLMICGWTWKITGSVLFHSRKIILVPGDVCYQGLSIRKERWSMSYGPFSSFLCCVSTSLDHSLSMTWSKLYKTFCCIYCMNIACDYISDKELITFLSCSFKKGICTQYAGCHCFAKHGYILFVLT